MRNPTVINCSQHGWLWGTWMVLGPTFTKIDCICELCFKEKQQKAKEAKENDKDEQPL